MSTTEKTAPATTTSTSPSSPSATTTPIQSSSKLQPAPAPLVSAWGKSSSSLSSKSSQNGIQTHQWPTAEAALDSAANKNVTKESQVKSNKPSPSIPAPKVKSTGKEKWVPYEAEIVISSSSDNKKKNNNSNSNNKKKQNQGKPQQQKGGKDSNNASKAKKSSGHNNENKSKAQSGEKKTDIKGVEDLKISAKETTTKKNENGTKEASVPVDPLEENGDKSEQLKNKETDAGIDATNETSAKSSSSNQVPQVPQQQQFQQKKKFQHRNSEPFNSNNNNNNGQSFQHNNYNNNNKGGRRYHPNNKNNFNNYRHSVAGSGNYSNVPFLPFGYGYPPLVPAYANYYPAPISRSNSGSPGQDQFIPLNANGADIPAPIVPGGVFPQSVGYPFVEDLGSIIAQLNYYFSFENLLRDTYLRKQMNSQGFVPLKKLIEFNRLKALTGGNIQLLENALPFLPEIEAFEGKIRPRENWSKWVLPYEQRDDAGKEENENLEPEEPQKVSTNV